MSDMVGHFQNLPPPHLTPTNLFNTSCVNGQCCLCFIVQTEELIKALQDLENAASGDATVRQKIASLPQEVQDVSLLEKITGKKEEFG